MTLAASGAFWLARSMATMPFTAERALELVTGLRQQLLAMREHQDGAPSEPCQLGENHGLARARRETHEHAPHAGSARREHCVERPTLVGAKHGAVPVDHVGQRFPRIAERREKLAQNPRF